MNLIEVLLHVFLILVAVLHLYFMILEMYFWEKPLGLKAFKQSPEQAKATSVLAANQGLYNGFLAAGILSSYLFNHPEVVLAFRQFFLSCVIVAGIFGAATAKPKIFFIQALPAIVAVTLLCLT